MSQNFVFGQKSTTFIIIRLNFLILNCDLAIFFMDFNNLVLFVNGLEFSDRYWHKTAVRY